MHSPSVIDPCDILAGDRDLLLDNRRRVRGLSDRWGALQETHSIGYEDLRRKTELCEQTHRGFLQDWSQSQQRELEQTITHWDAQLDAQLETAEFKTLRSLKDEKEALAQERNSYKNSRAAEFNAFDQSRHQLKKRSEFAKEQATKSRDSALAKIERESRGLGQRMHEVREWIGLKSGSPTLASWTSQGIPGREGGIAAIETLDGVASSFENTKQQVFQAIDDLQRHPALRLVGYPLLIALGILSGAGAVGIAFAMKFPPLVWSIAGLSCAIIVPAVVSLGSLPLLIRALRKLFPPIVDLEKEAETLLKRGRKLIEQNYQNAFGRIDAEWTQELRALTEAHQQKLSVLDSEHQQSKKRIVEDSARNRHQFATSRRSEMENVDQRESQSLAAKRNAQAEARKTIDQKHAGELASLQKNFETSLDRATQRWQQGVHKVVLRVREQQQAIAAAFPPWESLEMSQGTWHRSRQAIAWPVGSIGVDARFAKDASSPEINADAIQEEHFPMLFDLLHHGSLVIDADPESRAEAQGVVRQLVLRAITSLPAGAMQVTVIDPEGLGKEFSWMMHLADVDPQLVNHRAWTQPVHIAHQLELHARHVEDVIQQSLRNRFRTLADYNRHAGPMAIPYRLMVWSGFPLGLDEHSWQSLCSLLASGSRCGVGLILHLAENMKWPAFADPAKLREHGMFMELRSNPQTVSLVYSGSDDSSLTLARTPSETQLHAIMEHQLNAARGIGKRIVPFSSIAPADANHSPLSSSEGLEIPIGISESGRPQSLSLGTGTAQHVLIAGKTGSGKSSLLHTMITSAALRYSPEELRMVLLDFKKGVEFQVYAQEQLPHADILGIESRREFGLSALEYLDRILTARGEAFREWGVQDLPRLKRKYPEIVLPRILIVIDEFQELFVEDDKLSQQASLLVDRLVRQGRSFGMHLVLASQTLGGSYSLPRTTLAQMAVRIALQCDSSDAMLILNEDNNAAERLRHSGQGIYNDAGGRIEGNHNFQVSFLEKPEQMRWLRTLPPTQWKSVPTINPIGKRVVFEGHKPSRWEESSIRDSLQNAPAAFRSQAPWVLGESVSIEPPVLRALPPAAGRNVMIVGNDGVLVAGLLASWIRTSVVSDPTNMQKARFLILDGSPAEETRIAQAIDWARSQSDRVSVQPVRALEVALHEIQSEWNARSAAPDQVHPPLAIFILNLARFREFRRSDEFSFSSQEGELSPDALLVKLLSDGPCLGIHVCIWSDTSTTLNRWLPRNALRDIEVRILMQMSAADSNQLIDSSLANRLDRFVLLVHDDSDGKSVKFRPYELASILQDAENKP
jgi:S-DNA-T family DNA segregation ATPase FtsK/SpoIIIE